GQPGPLFRRRRQRGEAPVLGCPGGRYLSAPDLSMDAAAATVPLLRQQVCAAVPRTRARVATAAGLLGQRRRHRTLGSRGWSARGRGTARAGTAADRRGPRGVPHPRRSVGAGAFHTPGARCGDQTGRCVLVAIGRGVVDVLLDRVPAAETARAPPCDRGAPLLPPACFGG